MKLSIYQKGEIKGFERFFDKDCSRIRLKFLSAGIRLQIHVLLKDKEQFNPWIFYSESTSDNYFFAIQTSSEECLILTGFN